MTDMPIIYVSGRYVCYPEDSHRVNDTSTIPVKDAFGYTPYILKSLSDAVVEALELALWDFDHYGELREATQDKVDEAITNARDGK